MLFLCVLICCLFVLMCFPDAPLFFRVLFLFVSARYVGVSCVFAFLPDAVFVCSAVVSLVLMCVCFLSDVVCR